MVTVVELTELFNLSDGRVRAILLEMVRAGVVKKNGNGAVPRNGRYGIGAGTASLSNVAEDTLENECFIVKYFPGATLLIESYDKKYATYKPGNWIIEYTDPRKNITVGRDGLGKIPITGDLYGIIDSDSGKYAMKFEKYMKM